jgi:DNA mismatch repair ATPase MutS
MQQDTTTLKDLSIFGTDGQDVFSLIDHTTTQAGKGMLRKLLKEPPKTYEELQRVQAVVRHMCGHYLWSARITNGTLVMLEKYFETADGTTAQPSGFTLLISGALQKIFNRNEYFFTQFSLSHLSDFLQGCKELVKELEKEDVPDLLRQELQAMQTELQHPLVEELISINKNTPYKDLARLNYKARRDMKHATLRLIYHYSRLDAWHAMATATTINKWAFPVLQPNEPIILLAEGLYHPLLQVPVSYTVNFHDGNNFLLLTGANMSGKTTFMRAIGVAALLAHSGMGVPAKSFTISFLQGIITNMHVEDNMHRGESYFLAEVLRMKHTAERLVQQGAHLVLMDELFKGTNVHDAYECTKAIVEGLLQRPQHMMVLSTHLYEVAQHFNNRSGILFEYFVTETDNEGNYKFTYQLAKGISNDRIGYKILQKEGVIELLHQK